MFHVKVKCTTTIVQRSEGLKFKSTIVRFLYCTWHGIILHEYLVWWVKDVYCKPQRANKQHLNNYSLNGQQKIKLNHNNSIQKKAEKIERQWGNEEKRDN